jgi:hypothetical protein
VTQEDAIAIAREEVDFEPERVSVRFLPRGIPQEPAWAVSLSLVGAQGDLERVTVVVVDAETGEIEEVRRSPG